MLLIWSPRAEGSCSSLVSGNVVVDVQACQVVVTETAFPATDERFKWIGDLDPTNRAKFLSSYRGLILDVQVVASQAVRSGMSNDRGILLGDKVKMFIPPGKGVCPTFQQKRVAGSLKEVCCDGGGTAPCLLDTGYVLQSATVAGPAGAGNAMKAKGAKAQSSAEYQTGEKLIKEGKMKEGLKSLEAARSKKELDIRGEYMMAVAYRSADRCKDGIGVMRELYEKTDSPDLFEEERKMVRKATFLLARCYSRLNRPGDAVLILNSYLIEPAKFRDEISMSMRNPDFGFIQSSKEYRDYKKAAAAKSRTSEGPTP